METSSADLSPEERRELQALRQRIQHVEQELAGAQRALWARLKEIYSHRPLPCSEEELKRIVADENGLPLEAFLGELEADTQG